MVALYFHSDGYDTSRPSLMGRHSAGESFLRGYIRHGTADPIQFFNALRKPVGELSDMIKAIEPTPKDFVWHQSRRRLRDAGVLNMPVPNIDEEAWNRLPLGERAYALCGITHTTATATIMRILGDYMVAPLHDYDALICTSQAVRASIETQLEGVREHLTAHFGPRRQRGEPQRVTIPLGVNVADFAPSEAKRKEWRDRLAVPDDGILALYVGRFDTRAKMNPALMALALERAAQLTDRQIYWVMSGWAATDEMTSEFVVNTRDLCPSIEFRHIDGRPADTRFSIWSAADIFISFSDNIQETFGLTPVEAMAAGLPSVVSDWDGYRDTVRDGVDGFRVPTFAPAAGQGGDLAYAFQTRQLSYDNYVGAAGQFTVLDLGWAARAIARLANDDDLRRQMGAAAQAHAQATFDWSVIIPQYEALWAEQDARRKAAPPIQSLTANPYRPDPFTLFEGYPTQAVGADWVFAASPGTSWDQARTLLSSPLANYSDFNRMNVDEIRAVFEHLSADGPQPAGKIAERFAAPRRPFIQRALLWMARFGVLQLAPPR